ncbi:MAG: RNA-binding protein [Sphingomicrobium sp.]
MLAQAQQNDFDTGPRSLGAGAERLCVVHRQVKPVGEMIRFVVGPQGEAVPDLKRKLPGRGIWVTATRADLKEAVKRGAFAKGFGRPVKIPDDFVATTERLLERSALDALAIAGKGGQVLTGFSKVEAALRRGQAVALMHASDAAADGVRKLDSLRRQAEEEGQTVGLIAVFPSAQLDLALGRANVIHAALLAGSATETFIERCARLDRFRAGKPEQRVERIARKRMPKDQD